IALLIYKEGLNRLCNFLFVHDAIELSEKFSFQTFQHGLPLLKASILRFLTIVKNAGFILRAQSHGMETRKCLNYYCSILMGLYWIPIKNYRLLLKKPCSKRV